MKQKLLPKALKASPSRGAGSMATDGTDLEASVKQRPNLRIAFRAVVDLIPYEHNPRTHTDQQVAQIAASIVKFGWTNPILIGPDNKIIAGHARWQAARKLAMAEVPVIVIEGLSAAERKALVIADNRLALNAGWDEDLLRGELEELRAVDFDLDLLGFDSAELDDLCGPVEGFSGGLTDEDAVPEPKQEVVSRLSDLWILGRHHVLCGDATRDEDVDRLMGKARADLALSDCPYNVDYEGYTAERLKIQGDCMSGEEFQRFLDRAFASYSRISQPHASIYVCHPSSWQREFQLALETAGFAVRCQLIWAKNTFAWGFGRYKFQHEPIFYGHLAGGNDRWYGDKMQSTLWQENKPAANRLHPTMKPVELLERMIRNSSRKRETIVDLFGGSGSTLIACERMDRTANLMEIDPRFCDVIVRRWQEFTGKQASLEDGGETFAQVAQARRETAGIGSGDGEVCDARR